MAVTVRKTALAQRRRLLNFVRRPESMELVQTNTPNTVIDWTDVRVDMGMG
jgi:hypothetical protein